MQEIENQPQKVADQQSRQEKANGNSVKPVVKRESEDEVKMVPKPNEHRLRSASEADKDKPPRRIRSRRKSGERKKKQVKRSTSEGPPAGRRKKKKKKESTAKVYL